jgi:DNA-binding GntR family transcriptional regulator
MAREERPLTEPRIAAARRRTTVAMEVRNHLRDSIVAGRMLPGHPLSENEVAARLGLSRTPVREAFIKLEEEGLIAIYPQYGSFVAPIRVADIYDGQFVRESLECAALAKLVEILQPADAIALEAAVATQRRHLMGEPDPFFEADEHFHAALMQMAGHERAWSVVETAKRQHDRVRRLTVHDPLKRRAVFKEHSEIVDGILRRDPAAALDAMRRHLRGVFVSVEAVMQRHPEFFALTAESAAALPKRPAKPRRAVA